MENSLPVSSMIYLMGLVTTPWKNQRLACWARNVLILCKSSFFTLSGTKAEIQERRWWREAEDKEDIKHRIHATSHIDSNTSYFIHYLKFPYRSHW